MGRSRRIEERAREVVALLKEEYPVARCELDHHDAYELLVATILSAQCTDARVNQVTPALFERYPDPASLAAASQPELEELIRPTGFFRNKAASLIGMAQGLVSEHGGEVPDDIEALTTLPGVGRKTANVVLSVGYGLPGLAVDTHVARLSRRLGLTGETDPTRIEAALCSLLPAAEWGDLSLRLILHGRRVCSARRPRCEGCALAEICPSAALPVR